MKQYGLILQTATNPSLIILTKDQKIEKIFIIEDSHKISSLLMPAIEIFFKENKISVKDLKYIATSKGPGSFTGVRVGASIAKAFSYAQKIPLIAYNSLEILTSAKNPSTVLALDAKSSGVYIQRPSLKNQPIQLVKNEQLDFILKEKDRIYTLSKESLDKKLPSYTKKEINIFDTPINKRYLLQLVEERFSKKDFTTDGDFEVIYLSGPNVIE
ncbi:MAG TPA: tRNA (adenosine(37)-N6)-threonylcarbamoyltransferase complex dimerization subunit type 1 TsaB [Chlamydiales bacterium]|nr:tRNA (adenosine(37)-N6)-threonylcarbamoyltransferase complex dimerization subunit type 1 TsaB [Chlamydiales bacterium]